MIDKMKKMLAKKRDLSDDVEKQAKMDAVKEMRDMAAGMMSKRMENQPKKVMVAADSKENLKKGLEKAEELIEGSDAMDESHDDLESAEKAHKMLMKSMRQDDEMPEPEHPKEKFPLPEGNIGKTYEGGIDLDEEDADEQMEDGEFHGLSKDEIEEKLAKLMKLKDKLS